MPVTLTAPLYLFAMSLAGSAAFALWGWHSYKRTGCSVFVVVRVFLAFLAGPIWFWQLAISSIQLDSTSIAWTTGFPWARQPHFIDITGVRSVDSTEVGRGRNRYELWSFVFQDGSRQDVRITDLWRANRDEIADYFAQKGIQVPQ